MTTGYVIWSVGSQAWVSDQGHVFKLSAATIYRRLEAELIVATGKGAAILIPIAALSDLARPFGGSPAIHPEGD